MWVELLILLIILLILVFGLGFKVVPTGHVFIVERLGCYNRTLEVGLHWLYITVDRVVKKINIEEQVLSVETENSMVEIYFQIVDPKLFHYSVKDSELTISNLIKTLDHKGELQSKLEVSLSACGIKLNNLIIIKK